MDAVQSPTRPVLRARIERQVNELRSDIDELEEELDRLDAMGRYDVNLLRIMDAKQGDLRACLLLLTRG